MIDRTRELACHDIEDIRQTAALQAAKGRSHIFRVLCQRWNWLQPNGEYKEYAARDLLLRLEEEGYINYKCKGAKYGINRLYN
jgi:hypothetical protein